MAILMTGASGFIGQALIPLLTARGKRVYGLSRREIPEQPGVVPVTGDITQPNLGLAIVPEDIDTVYHVAGVVYLGEDKDGSVFRTNAVGTRNVVKFCLKNGIKRLCYVSTAYLEGRNAYERSKAAAEDFVTHSSIPEVLIFRPSIVMGDPSSPYSGHFLQFIGFILKAHRGAESVRRVMEHHLRLRPVALSLRVKGNPDGKLNLIGVDDVVEFIAKTDEPGVYYLTNPNPVRLSELAEWVSEYIQIGIKIVPEFKPNILERGFAKMAGAFLPYLGGDSFPSALATCRPIDKAFIQKTLGYIRPTI